MPITEQTAHVGCPYFAGVTGDTTLNGFVIALPKDEFLTCTPNNISSERGILSLFNYDLAKSARADAADRTAYLVYAMAGPDAANATVGRNLHALDVLMSVDYDYAVTSSLRNADARGARIQAYGHNNVSGVVTGAYINCQLKEGYTFNGQVQEGLSSFGGIGLEVRLETTGTGTVTIGTSGGSPASQACAMVISARIDGTLTGNLTGIWIEKTYIRTSVSGTKRGIYFGTGQLYATATDWDIGIDLSDECTTAIDIGTCTTGINFTSASTLQVLLVGTAANTDGSGISIKDQTHVAGELTPASPIKIMSDTDSSGVVAGDNATMWVRGLIGTTQTTSSATWSIVRSHIFIPAAVNLQSGFWNCVRGYIEMAGASTLSAATICLSGIEGYFGLSGAVTIGAAAVLACIKAIVANEASGSFTVSNELTAGSGKSIGYYIAPSTIRLTHGLYFARETCNVFAQLGELGQNADGSGLSMADAQHYSGEINPASLIKIFADSDSAAITGDNATLWVRDLIGTNQTSSATWSSMRGHTYIPTGVTLSAGFWNSIRGYVETAGTLTIANATIHLTGVEGYIGMTGTITVGAAGRVACLKAIMANEGSAAFSGAGIATGLLFCTSGMTMPNGIYFEGTYTTPINLGTLTPSSTCTSLINAVVSGTTAIKGIYFEITSTKTSSSLEGIRAEAICDAASGTASIRGGNFKANINASKVCSFIEGVLAHGSVAEGGVTVITLKGLAVLVSSGATLAATNVYGATINVHTRGDESIATDDVGLRIENEAVDGAGRMMDSAIQIVDTNVIGDAFACLIDASAAELETHDTDQVSLLKFKDDAGTTITMSYDRSTTGLVFA